MFRSAIRSAPQQAFRVRGTIRATRSSRGLSTAPPTAKSRSWKSSALRWGLAGGLVYYYNTNTLLAEEPEAAIQRLDQSIHHVQDSNLLTLEAIEEERRQRRAEIARLEIEKQRELEGKTALSDEEQQKRNDLDAQDSEEYVPSAEGLEEEAGQEGAFNPETGEINWDCPCLGGMAHGPCGEEFKAAFSCFVHSKEEPKGMECIDKFKGMQDCFREHPEMYGSELEDDEVEEEIEQQSAAKQTDTDTTPPAETNSATAPTADESLPKSAQRQSKANNASAAQPSEADSRAIPKSEKAPEKTESEQPNAYTDASSTSKPNSESDGDEGGEFFTRNAFDATASNAGK